MKITKNISKLYINSLRGENPKKLKITKNISNLL